MSPNPALQLTEAYGGPGQSDQITDAHALCFMGLTLISVGITTGLWNYFNAQVEQKHQVENEFPLYQLTRHRRES